VQAILTSYRWRRRLAWSGGLLATVGVLVALAVVLPKQHAPHYLAPTGTQQAVGQAQPKQVRVTAAERVAVNRTLVAFVRTGVTRADPAAAWTLTTASMRSGISKQDWLKGNLPVNPFPASISDQPSWRVLTSYPRDLTLDLVLQPKPGSHVGPIAFAVELKQERDGRWLVDSMAPEQTFGPSAPAPTVPKLTVTNGKAAGPHAVLGPIWIIVPAGLLALIVLVPLAVLLNNWRKTRAIERRYRRERGS
jgi:hypothetical protein